MSGKKSCVKAAVDLLEDGAPLLPGEGHQLDLIGGEISAFSGETTDFDVDRRPGRPKGARNKRTQELAEFIKKRYGHPVLALAEIAFMPTARLAEQLKIKLVEAFDRQVAIRRELAEYTDQKMPRAIEVQGEGMIVFQLGVTPEKAHRIAGQGEGGVIIDMVPVENLGDEKDEENQ